MAKLHVIVPLGREASRGDQIENAAYFVKKGYAEELQESDLTLDSLEREAFSLTKSQGRLPSQDEGFQGIEISSRFLSIVEKRFIIRKVNVKR